MRFSIITPSFRNSDWLKVCIASVADQQVPMEHIVQDSCSDDGTQEWLPQDPRVKAFIEKDKGMYDAVNRGLRRATGDLLAYINCDEQYLPGALASVAAFFEQNPRVEVLFADALVVDPQGNYLCHRTACLPQEYHTQVSGNLSILTCATFFRRSVLDDRQLFFNSDLRDLGDVDWVLRLLRGGAHLAIMPQFVSTFTETGDNMNLRPNAQREKRAFRASAPTLARAAAPLVILHYRARRFLGGHYRQRPPFDYAIFTRDETQRRTRFQVDHPTFRWRR